MGANPHKGEAAVEVDGKAYVLAFNINAMCEVEYVLNLSTDRILRSLTISPPLHVVRALLWGGLRLHHPDVDLLAAGAMMEKLGGAGLALDAIGAALISAFPEAKEEPDTSHPPKGASAGTGRRSSRRGSQ